MTSVDLTRDELLFITRYRALKKDRPQNKNLRPNPHTLPHPDPLQSGEEAHSIRIRAPRELFSEIKRQGLKPKDLGNILASAVLKGENNE